MMTIVVTCVRKVKLFFENVKMRYFIHNRKFQTFQLIRVNYDYMYVSFSRHRYFNILMENSRPISIGSSTFTQLVHTDF